MKFFAQLAGATAALAVILSFAGVRIHQTPSPVSATPRPDREVDQGRKRILPLRPLRELSPEQAIQDGYVLWADNMGPGGRQPLVDYPEELWKKNIGGSDGAGMCVFRSCEFQALWIGLPFQGFTEWCAKGPGGGYPEKLAKLFSAFCKEKHIVPEPTLIQYEGRDFAWVEACLANGWLPCITLYHSPRYGPGTIYHMTCAGHLDKEFGATQDNNFRPLEWAPRTEWEKRCMLNGQFWAFAIVGPGVPLPPRN
jgi:hypothetical protein